MADLNKALKKLWGVEYSNDPKRMLHVVDGDTGGMTYAGIARNYHPKWEGWAIVDGILKKNKGNTKLASVELFTHDKLQTLVHTFYETNFWDKIKGDSITYQATAEEMFLSAVNIGIVNCIKLAQRASKAVVDGVIGNNTITAINSMSPALFCDTYTELEVHYYTNIVKRNPKQQKFLNGWIARAEVINGDNADSIV